MAGDEVVVGLLRELVALWSPAPALKRPSINALLGMRSSLVDQILEESGDKRHDRPLVEALLKGEWVVFRDGSLRVLLDRAMKGLIEVGHGGGSTIFDPLGRGEPGQTRIAPRVNEAARVTGLKRFVTLMKAWPVVRHD